MRYAGFGGMILVALAVGLAVNLRAADPPRPHSSPEAQGVALNAIKSLFADHDIEAFKAFVAKDAVQGNREPGSALAKVAKQRSESLRDLTITQILFFQQPDIDELQKAHPDNLWQRVQKHIGDQQGVLIKLALTGELAERAQAVGKDPRNLAMMTFVVSTDEKPRIVHIDDN